MRLPINDHLYISSNSLNWMIMRKLPKSGDEVSLGNYRDLSNAVAACMGQKIQATATEMEQVSGVCKRLSQMQRHLQVEFATSRPQSELAELGIALEVSGYRFEMSDPCSVHRQVRSINGWQSKQYYNSLLHALDSTLVLLARRSEANGGREALSAISAIATNLASIKTTLPRTYWTSVEAAPPNTRVINAAQGCGAALEPEVIGA